MLRRQRRAQRILAPLSTVEAYKLIQPWHFSQASIPGAQARQRLPEHEGQRTVSPGSMGITPGV